MNHVGTTMRSHEEATIERFRRDADLAAQYLEAILKDNDQNEVTQARTLLAKSFGPGGLGQYNSE